VEFFEAPAFTRHVGRYLDDLGLLALQLLLMEQPDAGAIMPGTGGFRKLRWRDDTRGKGKRGGLRIIYVLLPENDQIWLFTLYGKDEADDLTPDEKRQLRSSLDLERKSRQARSARRRER